MRRSRLALVSLLCAAAATIALACGEDTATVRTRVDGGATDAGDAGLTYLTCGVPVPATYDSPAFATNAKEELDLRAAFTSLDARMQAAEGTGTSVVTTAELRGILEQGTPSLKFSSTTTAQALVDANLVAFGGAIGKAWSPDLFDADAGDAGAPTTGGKYQGAYVSTVGLSLRRSTDEILLGGALYNHALAVASGAVTEATIDRLLASYGASTKLLRTSDPDAGADADALLAAYAAKRDDPSQASGPYRRIRSALLRAKAAAAAGVTCKNDLTASLAVFFGEWEKATYASAIYALNDAASKALASPPSGGPALQSLGEALGFVESFKGISPDRRKITDAQIDDVLAKAGAAAPYELLTKTSARVPSLVDAIQTIAGVYGFSSAEVEAFEKVF